jgi:tungstate transport system substrate-binding protein
MPAYFANVSRLTVVATLLLLAAGCGLDSDASSTLQENSASDAGNKTNSNSSAVLRLASSTSTRDSGLFDILLPVFEKTHNCRVDLVAVGTGAALKLGEAGDVDALVVHAPSAEEAFMKAGHGVRHEAVMHNSFLIVGPAADPADVVGSELIPSMRKIKDQGHKFLSRGDDSGTHMREMALWEIAGGKPDGENYLESGQGMGPTLVMADEMQACTLVDQGTWLKQKEKLELIPIVTEGLDLLNPYSAIVVNSKKNSAINSKLADAFVDFLISDAAQKLIDGYEIDGQKLFHADRLNVENVE